MLDILKLVAVFLSTNALGEESSVLELATVSDYGLNKGNTYSTNALIDGNFVSKTVFKDDDKFLSADGSAEFTIILD